MQAIHPTAVIHPGAELHPTVRVGAYAVIGPQVKVGAETIIDPHVVIDGDTVIGDRNHIFVGAAIGLDSQDLKYTGEPSQVRIGNDNRIREYVTINRANQAGEATRIGDQNLIMAYVHIAHDCIVGDRVVIANAVSVGGHVVIESQAVIGGMVGIHQFVQIGRLAMVGAMSRIDRDVPPYVLVEGHPARVRSLNLVGLKRSGLTTEADGQPFQALKKAFRLLYRSGLTFPEALPQVELLGDYECIQHLHHFLQFSLREGRRGLIPGKGAKGEEP